MSFCFSNVDLVLFIKDFQKDEQHDLVMLRFFLSKIYSLKVICFKCNTTFFVYKILVNVFG